jgi:hypothetical protein
MQAPDHGSPGDMVGPNVSPLRLHDPQEGSGPLPSQQSFYHNGPPENASLTNRPRFDQISDATKYVFNQQAINAQMDPNLGNSGGRLSNQPQPTQNLGFQGTGPSNGAFLTNQGVRNSPATHNVIEEEDYQQSSHAQFARLGSGHVSVVDNQQRRT